MSLRVLSETKCILGEGAFWHPERGQFFWFDIIGKQLLTLEEGVEKKWDFEECVSACGWIDRDRLFLASASGLWDFDITTGARDHIADLEAQTLATRSNDGRADPWGGFWIGTMGYNCEPGLGAIYRYYRGELTQLFDQITISNAICFAPDRSCAYFTDTAKGQIMRQPLRAEDGFPDGAPEVFVDLSKEDFGPDGAVVDAAGNLWNAQWGAARVACYGPNGALKDSVSLPTEQVSCPSLGGPNFDQLYVTTASEGNTQDPEAGKTFITQLAVTGQAEHQVIL